MGGLELEGTLQVCLPCALGNAISPRRAVRVRQASGLCPIPQEVYYVLSGRGGVRVDGERRDIGPGDVVAIFPGQRHKVWQEGEDDLVLLVTCVPAYSVEEVVFTE